MRAFNPSSKFLKLIGQTVPAVKIIINNTPSWRLGNGAPITVHAEIESRNLLIMAPNSTKIAESESIDEVRTRQKLKIKELLDSLHNMHKSVLRTLSDSRKKAIYCHNNRTLVLSYNLRLGDYVMFVTLERQDQNISELGWTSPNCIISLRLHISCSTFSHSRNRRNSWFWH